jgi:membrane complex biogenesis BtpA family protein
MFSKKCSIVGVVHVPPLPGAAGYKGGMDALITSSLTDALRYAESGIDALMVENMHDVPYLKGFVHPETTAAMSVIARTLKDETGLPLGIQLLAGANLESLGAAVAAGADFIRVEGFVYAHVGDEGIHEACAAPLIRRRANLHAEGIRIFADIKKKHASHAITGDIDLVDTARHAEFFHADGVIVTGPSTGHAPAPGEVSSVRAAVACAVLVGSGVDEQNIDQFMPHADALIVGSSLKIDGSWKNAVDPHRVKRLMDAAARAAVV